MPADSTQERLDAVLRIPTVERLRRVRAPILAAAASRGLSDVRVLGSVARGTAGSASDVDLLVHPASHASMFDLARFMVDVEELLGIRVDVVSDRGHGPTMERIRAEAVTL